MFNSANAAGRWFLLASLATTLIAKGAAAQTAPAAQSFGPVTVTAMRSAAQPDGSEVVAFTAATMPSLSAGYCGTSTNPNSWFGNQFSIRSTQANFKTMLSMLTSALLAGKPVSGYLMAGCGGAASTLQAQEIAIGP